MPVGLGTRGHRRVSRLFVGEPRRSGDWWEAWSRPEGHRVRPSQEEPCLPSTPFSARLKTGDRGRHDTFRVPRRVTRGPWSRKPFHVVSGVPGGASRLQRERVGLVSGSTSSRSSRLRGVEPVVGILGAPLLSFPVTPCLSCTCRSRASCSCGRRLGPPGRAVGHATLWPVAVAG